MIALVIGLYVLGWFITAVAYAYAERDAAAFGDDPVGAGLALGLIWPIAWLTVLAGSSVEFCVRLLQKIRP